MRRQPAVGWGASVVHRPPPARVRWAGGEQDGKTAQRERMCGVLSSGGLPEGMPGLRLSNHTCAALGVASLQGPGGCASWGDELYYYTTTDKHKTGIPFKNLRRTFGFRVPTCKIHFALRVRPARPSWSRGCLPVMFGLVRACPA